MQDVYRAIHADPRFHELERKRSRLSWMLAAVVLANATWYTLATAFFPAAAFARFWGKPVADGAATTWGIVIGIAQIVVFVAFVVYYTRRANGEFDALRDMVVRDALGGADTPS